MLFPHPSPTLTWPWPPRGCSWDPEMDGAGPRGPGRSAGSARAAWMRGLPLPVLPAPATRRGRGKGRADPGPSWVPRGGWVGGRVSAPSAWWAQTEPLGGPWQRGLGDRPSGVGLPRAPRAGWALSGLGWPVGWSWGKAGLGAEGLAAGGSWGAPLGPGPCEGGAHARWRWGSPVWVGGCPALSLCQGEALSPVCGGPAGRAPTHGGHQAGAAAESVCVGEPVSAKGRSRARAPPEGPAEAPSHPLRDPGLGPARLSLAWPCSAGSGRTRGRLQEKSARAGPSPVSVQSGLPPGRPPGTGVPRPTAAGRGAGARPSLGLPVCTVDPGARRGGRAENHRNSWGGGRHRRSATERRAAGASLPARAAQLRMKRVSFLFLFRRSRPGRPAASGPPSPAGLRGQLGVSPGIPPAPPTRPRRLGGHPGGAGGRVGGPPGGEAAVPGSPCLASER